MDFSDSRLHKTLGEAAKNDFVEKYGLTIVADPVFRAEHEPCHILAKEIGSANYDFALPPTIKKEMIVIIYQVILNKERPSFRIANSTKNKDEDLSFEEIKKYVELLKDSLEDVMEKNFIDIPDNIIQYHRERAEWIKENIKTSTSKYYHEMGSHEK